MTGSAGNILYYGDNLDVLARHVKDESVDLVYLDPPFNSNASYSVLFGHADGAQSAAQIKAFDDTWRWDQTASAAFQNAVSAGGSVAQALVAFQALLGPSMMLAYLSMMAPRLVELRRVLKKNGSLFLHCDPTASHYLKLLLDAVFGAGHFRNEIAWYYESGGRASRFYPRKHDTIFWYSKHRDTWTFNAEAIMVPRDDCQLCGTKLEKWNNLKKNVDADGRIYRTIKSAGKVYCYYDDEPVLPADVWIGISHLQQRDPERLGYPTQKPEALLERVIRGGSNPGDVVLDPFCGCGTTIAVAERLKRHWAGIDLTYLAISLIKSRLTVSGTSDYAVLGEPTTADDAAQLAASDPYQFQWWALGLVGARPAEGKKGADKGMVASQECCNFALAWVPGGEFRRLSPPRRRWSVRLAGI